MDKDIQKAIDLLGKEVTLIGKETSLELDRMGEAFKKISNVLDLLYLEVAVLLEMLNQKNIIDEDSFAKQLKETSDKIEKHIQERMALAPKDIGAAPKKSDNAPGDNRK